MERDWTAVRGGEILVAQQSVDEIHRLREENTRLRAKLADIEAGCDIQKSHGLYRQVRVVIGPGKIQAEIDRAQLQRENERLRGSLRKAAGKIADAEVKRDEARAARDQAQQASGRLMDKVARLEGLILDWDRNDYMSGPLLAEARRIRGEREEGKS